MVVFCVMEVDNVLRLVNVSHAKVAHLYIAVGIIAVERETLAVCVVDVRIKHVLRRAVVRQYDTLAAPLAIGVGGGIYREACKVHGYKVQRQGLKMVYTQDATLGGGVEKTLARRIYGHLRYLHWRIIAHKPVVYLYVGVFHFIRVFYPFAFFRQW